MKSLQFKYNLADGNPLLVRKATIGDSKETAKILNSIVEEKKYTMCLAPISEEEEKIFIKNLDKREGIFVAFLEGKIIGYLILTIPDKICRSTLHVGEIGTFILKKYRGLGVGDFLLTSGVKFAQKNNFEKMIIKVRSSNIRAQRFYSKNGFKEIGRLKKEIKIDGKYEDHILMERFLD